MGVLYAVATCKHKAQVGEKVSTMPSRDRGIRVGSSNLLPSQRETAEREARCSSKLSVTEAHTLCTRLERFREEVENGEERRGEGGEEDMPCRCRPPVPSVLSVSSVSRSQKMGGVRVFTPLEYMPCQAQACGTCACSHASGSLPTESLSK